MEGVPVLRIRSTWVLALALATTAVLAAGPAGAGKLFTVDFDQEFPLSNDLDGTDDLFFKFDGSIGDGNAALLDANPNCAGPNTADTVCGVIRATNVVSINLTDLTSEIQAGSYTDFSGGGNTIPPLDLRDFDTLVVDVVLFDGSASIDEIGIGISTDTSVQLNPDGAGWMIDCDGSQGALPTANCRDASSGSIPFSGAPLGVALQPGTPPIGPFPGFPGAAIFNFGNPLSSTLNAGETSRRLFVTYLDPGDDDDTPLDKFSQVVKFMISSGAGNEDFESTIIPEPATALLLGFGVAALAAARSRRTG